MFYFYHMIDIRYESVEPDAARFLWSLTGSFSDSWGDTSLKNEHMFTTWLNFLLKIKKLYRDIFGKPSKFLFPQQNASSRDSAILFWKKRWFMLLHWIGGCKRLKVYWWYSSSKNEGNHHSNKSFRLCVCSSTTDFAA